MAWKLFTPNTKRKRYEEQIKTGKDHKGNALSEKDIGYREGYAKAVKDNNRIFAIKNATPEQRAQYKEKQKAYKKGKENK